MPKHLVQILKYSCLTVATIFTLFVALVMWELGVFGDWGLESGYYGEYNRVRKVIEEMPDVEIVERFQHRDTTLEDFGFTIVVDGELEVSLWYQDNSPEKTEPDRDRIREHIEAEIEKARREASPDL